MSFYILGRKCSTRDSELAVKKHSYHNKTSSNITRSHFKDLDPFMCSTNGPEAYKCYYCNFKTDFLVEYNKHVAQTKAKPVTYSCKPPIQYICSECSFETFSRLILLRHAHMRCAQGIPNLTMFLAISEHSKGSQRQIKLLLCDRDTLKITIPPCSGAKVRYYHYKTSKNYACEICPFRGHTHTSLTEHTIRKHTEEKDIEWLQCDQCPYRAKVQENLTRHRFKQHQSPEKQIWFQCKQCPYRSAWRPDYIKHFRKVHSIDAKWYECDKCPHRTKYITHFKRHVREQHSDNFKWLQCEHCPYKAKQKIHMKLHVVQKHTAVEDIEWYECEQCSYKAKIKASLKNHVLKKHVPLDRVNWFMCEKCGYKVRQKSLLKKHFEKKHK